MSPVHAMQSILLRGQAMERLTDSAAPGALAALWQGAVVACGLAICLALAPRIPARHRFLVWASGFAVLIGLPFLPLLVASGAPQPGAPAAASGPWLELDGVWSLALAGLWAALSLLRAVNLARHALYLRRLSRSAIPVNIALGPLPRRARVSTSREIDRPSVIGFLSPHILVPEWLLGRLTAGELDQIVLHESEHLRRGDDWTNLVQKICLVLFPLNPALWWIDRQLSKAREMACDEGVVRITRAPRAYAACLASLAERRIAHRTEALSLGAWQRRPELAHRVHRILDSRRALHPAASAALLSVLGCGLAAASVALARCPELIGFTPADSWQADRGQADRGQADRGQADRGQADRGQADRGQTQLAAVTRPAAAATSGLAFGSVPVIPVRAQVPSSRPSSRRISAAGARGHRGEFAAARLTALEANPRQEQWLVLTAWEQVEPAPGPGPAAVATATSPSPAGRVTLTRLIFRVIPTDSRSMPGGISIPSGWLVIQL